VVIPVRRRDLITLVGAGIIVRPAAAGAQQKAMPVIGFLHSLSLSKSAQVVAAFRQGLSQAGYIEGQNELVPQTRVIALLGNPNVPTWEGQISGAQL
jgi:hypothetical protein